MAEVLLSLKHISKNFGEGNVLSDVSLDVHRGEFVTLLGASGCGKTTTLRIVSGLETPDTGEVILNGKDMTDLPPESCAGMRFAYSLICTSSSISFTRAACAFLSILRTRRP